MSLKIAKLELDLVDQRIDLQYVERIRDIYEKLRETGGEGAISKMIGMMCEAKRFLGNATRIDHITSRISRRHRL